MDDRDTIPAGGPLAVQARGLARRFDRAYALRDFTLDLPAGKTLLLVGPNGAGKTTLLRLLATGLRPSRGTACVFGHDLLKESDDVRRLSVYVGVAHGMYAGLTARENLAFAASMSGRADHGAAVLDRVGLAPVADRLVRTFSHGMTRRLALARAWLLDPRLLLLDDPFSGLDAEGTHLVDVLVAEVKAAGGSVILATHEWERGRSLADEVIGLTAGRQVEAPRARAAAGGS